jgi:hypothetical protein
MRRTFGAIAVLLLVLATAPPTRAERPFGARFTENAPGDVVIVGNTLMTCPAAAAGCLAARAGSGSGPALNNNSYAMERVDVDGDPGTIDSSSATLALPPGATVRFAGL